MERGQGASLFHATLAAGLAQWTQAACEAAGIGRVVFSGGCFLNAILSRALCERLEKAGLQVYEARQAPPNDGGLALGQAWVAMQAMEG
jgi:hydrogenase maturation protein HypF